MPKVHHNWVRSTQGQGIPSVDQSRMASLHQKIGRTPRRPLMREAGLTQRRRRLRSVIIAMAASIALIVTVAATNSVVSAARAITRDSSSLSETDGAIRSATVARTLTVLAAVAVQDGSNSPDITEARTAVDDLAARSNLAGPGQAFVDATNSTLTSIQQGLKVSPQQVAAIENTFHTLLTAQLSQRSDLATALAASQKQLDQMSKLAGVALLFIVPVVAIFVYRGLTKPDLTQARLIHRADLDQRDERNQRTALAHRVTSAKAALEHASTAEMRRRLAEISAIIGPGFDGNARDQMPVDVRGAIAKAVLVQDSTRTITVSGDLALAIADESSLVDLLGLLLVCIDGLESPAIVVKETSGNVVVSVSGVGSITQSAVLEGPRIWDHELDDDLDVRLAAARSLAEAGGSRIRQLTKGGRCGFTVVIPGATHDTTLTGHRRHRAAAAA